MKLEAEFIQEVGKALLSQIMYIEESNENADVVF